MTLLLAWVDVRNQAWPVGTGTGSATFATLAGPVASCVPTVGRRTMRRWEFGVALDASREQPLFLQLAGAVAAEIRCGRLKPGEALPGSRELAERLGVNRNTIVAGYDELAAEGLVHARVGGGTFVSVPLQKPSASPAFAGGSHPTFALARPLQMR